MSINFEIKLGLLGAALGGALIIAATSYKKNPAPVISTSSSTNTRNHSTGNSGPEIITVEVPEVVTEKAGSAAAKT